MSDAQGYQWTPMGIVPLGQPVPVVAPETVSPAGASFEAKVVTTSDTPTKTAAKTPASHADNAVNPKTVLRSAKVRVREIKAELRRMKKLQKELAQLEALVEAASKPTHLAPVRALSSSRK
jgi:hypothetical protein